MGDQIQKAPEAEPAQVTPVIEEPHESHSLRKENVRGILSGKSFNAKIGAADDPVESRADSMANAALSKNISNSSSIESTASQTAISSLQNRPLTDIERTFFEPRFNTNFSDVRLNYSSDSSKFASDMNARAFTHGSDIHFSNSGINFDSNSGRKTLAHELAHVVQNRQNGFNENIIRREVEFTNRVEFTTRFRDEDGDLRDNALNIELGVLVRVFYNLQQAGLIGESEHLGDNLSICQKATMDAVIDEMGEDYDTPETYEAALRVLVTDANDDDRFDVNAELLNRSGLLNTSGVCMDDSIIVRALNADLDPTREWLIEQSSNADNSRNVFGGASTEFVTQYGGVTDEGRAVTGLSGGSFETDIERFYNESKTMMRALVAEPNLEGLVTTAISRATDLRNASANQKAAQLVALALRAVVSNSGLTGQILQALTDEYRLQGIETERVNIRLSSELGFDFDRNDDIEIREDSSDFWMPLSEVVTLTESRRGFVSTIATEIAEDVSQTPTLEQMTEYMHNKVRTASLEEVKRALGEALTSQFVHSGGGVDYEGFPGATRSSNMQGLYDALSQDGAGRFVVDCDGFVAIARHFLDAGTRRFGFVFMDKRTRMPLRENVYRGSTHALMAVCEGASQQGFIVDNNNIRGDFTFDMQGTFSDLYTSIGVGLRAMGYTSPLVEVYMSQDQSIYDAGDDPNRWSWPHWSPSTEPTSE